MPVYAQPADLDEWMAPTAAPDNATALLRSASYRVADATKTAVYDIGTNGLPADVDLRDALRDATCAQVAVWAALGNTPGLGGLDTKAAVRSKQVGSMSIGIDTSVASSVTASEVRRKIVDEDLCRDAMLILDQAGLLNGPIVSYG